MCKLDVYPFPLYQLKNIVYTIQSFQKGYLIYPYFERVKLFSLKVTFINVFWKLNTKKRISNLSKKLTNYIYSKNTSLSHLLAQLVWASPSVLCRVERHRFESHTTLLFLPVKFTESLTHSVYYCPAWVNGLWWWTD